MMKHWTSDQMREVRNEEEIVDEVIFPRDASMRIDEKRDLGEGEEGYAQRQDDIFQAPMRHSELSRGTDKKIRVFEVTKQKQVSGNGGGESPNRSLGRLGSRAGMPDGITH